MKRISTFVIIIYALACIGIPQADAQGLKGKTPNKDRIRPYSENPRYWQYNGKPILLLGGSKDDNLFQIPDMKEHLDSLEIIGANYIRNVMSSREDFGFEVQPFKKLAKDKYDLNQWNNEYWDRFQEMLQLTAERDIIVQIEIWAFHDLNLTTYPYSPWKPANNINYDTLNTTLSNQSVNFGRHKHEFFFTVPKLNNDTLVLKYQNLFVDKILTYTLEYDHILYCITNEIHPQYSPEWGWYWANYIRGISNKKGKAANITEMFWETDLTRDQHKASLDYPDIYNYFEISQNSANSGEKNWTYTRYIRKYLSRNPRPVNSVKIYGSDTGPFWAGKSKDGIEKFWRNILGGCAGSRFHRPHGGIGFSELAQNSIKAVRKLETLIKLWEVSPDNKLLTERDENEAYIAAKPGEKYIIYFTEGGMVGLNLIDYQEKFCLRWIDINTGDWLKGQTYLEGGQIVNISTPFQNPSIAMILKMNLFTIDE